VKLLRTIRLDPSDTFVFAKAAESGEWAVPGTFVFWDADVSAMEGKERTAFRSGFLGVDSLGWSTLVQVVEANEDDRKEITELLAKRLQERFGAPSLNAARAAAAEEVAFAASLCDHEAGTLVALHRAHEKGDLRETFRTLKRREGKGMEGLRAFSFYDVEGEDEPAERVDLIGMAKESK
jgi:hypothetical protein